MRSDAWRFPKPPHAVDVRRREIHMRGKLIGEPADFAAAHRIGLPRQREGRRTDLANAAGGKMAVNDRVDLVGALRRLVDALRIQRDDARGRLEHLEKGRDIGLGQACCESRRSNAAGDAARACQGCVEAIGVGRDIIAIERVVIGKVCEQARKQRRVGAGLEAKKQISVAGCIGAARIDHDHARAARLFVLEHPLKQYRMAPRGIRADKNQQVCLIEILVIAGYGIRTESAAMAGDR